MMAMDDSMPHSERSKNVISIIEIMKKHFDLIASLVISFVVSIALNAAWNYHSAPQGSVVLGDRIGNFRPVDIVNSGSAPIDGLILSIPVETEIAEIIASRSVQISPAPDSSISSGFRLLTVGALPPHRRTRILVPIPNQGPTENQVAIVNAEDLMLGGTESDAITDPLNQIVARVLVNSVFYGIILGFFGWFATRLLDRQETINADFEQTVARANSQAGELRQEVTELDARNSRLRLLLHARLTDHAKELDFWRNTIRRLLYAQGLSKREGETVLDNVTTELSTFSTRFTPYDISAAITVGGLLTDRHAKRPSKRRISERNTQGAD